VKRHLVLALVVCAACYSPRIKPGSPCDDDHPCPTPLICTLGTCETSITDVEIDAGAEDAPLAGCVPTGIDICGDGIDQDCSGSDAACADNDVPGKAIDITKGGTFTANLLLAHDDLASKGCGGDGGSDVFYEITLTAPQVYYFDTFTSGFDTSLRVFPGKACAAVTNALFPMCNDDACGTGESQLALGLPAGTSCLVVDKNVNGGQEPDKGTFQLHVVAGGRAGARLPSAVATQTGDTCGSTNVWEPTKCGPAQAKDLAYYFTVCPATTLHLDASTCSNPAATHFDTELYLRPAGGTDLACVDDTDTCAARPDRSDGHPDGSILTNEAAKGPGLYWLVVDGFDASSCGGYQLDTNLR
jgi:hypothetical protein